MRGDFTKQEKAEFKIYCKITSVHTAVCSKCGLTEDIKCDSDLDASEMFYKGGWHATDINLYCKNCKRRTKATKQAS